MPLWVYRRKGTDKQAEEILGNQQDTIARRDKQPPSRSRYFLESVGVALTCDDSRESTHKQAAGVVNNKRRAQRAFFR